MAIEIERKFLLLNDDWRKRVSHACKIRQGYFFLEGKSSIRIRCVTKGDAGSATINVKQAVVGPQRLEFEYEIPCDEALQMLDTLCEDPLIEKTRHEIHCDDLVWEVDEFAGGNDGLVVAEVELQDAGQTLPLPGWVGREVTDERRYYNMSLVRYPFCDWREEDRR